MVILPAQDFLYDVTRRSTSLSGAETKELLHLADALPLAATFIEKHQ